MRDEHYCDCCGHVHGDLEAYQRVSELEAKNKSLRSALDRLDEYGYASLAVQLVDLEATNATLLEALQLAQDDLQTWRDETHDTYAVCDCCTCAETLPAIAEVIRKAKGDTDAH